MANTQYPEQMSYQEISQGSQFLQEEGASQVAKSKVETAMAGQGGATLEQYISDQSRIAERTAKLSEAKLQTEQMKKAMDFEKKNFNQSLMYQRQLEGLDSAATKQMLQDEKQFKLDSAGRKMLSERQLADWYSTKAQNEEDWQGFAQRQQQLHDRRMQMLQTAKQRIVDELNRDYQQGAIQLDQSTKMQLARMKAALEKKISEEKTKAANGAAMTGALSSIGAIGGGIVGGYFGAGNPAAIAAGSAIGGAAGGLLGQAMSK